MKDSSSQSKAARRKLEVPMPAATPCKIQIKSFGKTHRSIGKRMTKYACVVDANDKARRSSTHKHCQDHITEKGMNSLNHYSLDHKFIPMLQAMRIPDAKAAVVKEWEKVEKIPARQLKKSETRKR